MKKILSYLSAGVLVMASPASLFAIEKDIKPITSIEELVARVLSRNPELKFYEEEIRAAKAEERTSGLLDNPEMETSIGRKSDFSREGTAWSVAVVQTFEFPGRLSLRKAIANRQVSLAELGFERFKMALAAKATQSAYRLLAAQQLSEAALSVSSRGRELVKVLVQRDPAGVTPLLETRIIEANVIALQKRAIDAQQEVHSSLFELSQLTGDPLSSALRIGPCDVQLKPIPSTDELITSALHANFELKMKLEELKAQGFRVELAKNERYPAFKIGPFYSEEKAGERERIAGLGISVPLPLWNQNRGAIDTARARETQAKTSLLLARREFQAQSEGLSPRGRRGVREGLARRNGKPSPSPA